VFDDADLEVAANALIASKFRNNGQVCIASNRILVQEGVYNEFSELLTKKVSALKCGNGMTSGIHVGPLINKQGLEKVFCIIIITIIAIIITIISSLLSG